MMNQYFDGMVSKFEAKFQQRPTARKKFSLEILRLGQRFYSGAHGLAWCGVCVPFDLLTAMGITSCFVEFVGGMLASTGHVGPFLEQSEHDGFLTDGCGFQRAVIGAAAKGIMPVPDVLIATNSPCAGGVATIEHLARTFDRPLYVLNVPPDDSEASVEYLADQFRGMVDFVAEHTHHTLDEARLRNAINKTNRAREIQVEVFRLAQSVPSPANGTGLKNFGILMPLFFGSHVAIEIAEAYRAEFAARVEQGTGAVQGERFRLMWLQEAIQFKHPLIELLEKNYQATVVVEELNDVSWDPIDTDDPYTGLARRTIAFPFNGPVDRRLKRIKRLVEAYQIDGAINPCHWGCRQGTGARGLLEGALKDLDIPVINLEVDCMDSRNFAEGQVRTRLEAFMEVLDSRSDRRAISRGGKACSF